MFQIPLNSLIVMVGPSGAGKSTFVNQYFKSHEIVSTDNIREELTGDLRNQHMNPLVFGEFYRRIETKIQLGERVVADASHLHKKDRIKTAQIGIKYHVPVFYIVVNRPLEEKIATAGWRLRAPGLIQRYEERFKSQEREICSGDNIATVIDTRLNPEIKIIEKFNFDNLSSDLRHRGYKEIEIIGDVHGMIADFEAVVNGALEHDRMIIQLGDIVDYGPDSVSCIELTHKLVMCGKAIFIIGNHERKFEKYIQQRRSGNIRLQVKGGIVATVKQFDGLGDARRELIENKFLALMNYARHHVIIDNYIFVHAGTTESMWSNYQNRLTGFEENRAVFGEVSGFREDGFPNRIYNWVDEIPEGKTAFVGHDIRSMENPLVHEGNKGGKAIFVDTGSGKDGKLSSIVKKI